MESMELMPGVRIHSDRCLIIGGTMVIADLHVGYESSLAKDGMYLPRIQTRQMTELLADMLDRFEPERVVVLGDLKHEFSRNLDQEWREVQSILSLLQSSAEVTLIRGNHDNYLATISSRMGIPLVDSLKVGEMTLAHGHVDCGERPLVMGHEHPSLRLMDGVGAFVKLPCFLHHVSIGVTVVPAFSPLALGTDLSSMEPGKFLSPVLRGRDMSEAQIVACSDIGLLRLGSLSDLMGMGV